MKKTEFQERLEHEHKPPGTEHSKENRWLHGTEIERGLW